MPPVPPMEDLDALLENEDLADFEQSAFMSRSKLMLSAVRLSVQILLQQQ